MTRRINPVSIREGAPVDGEVVVQHTQEAGCVEASVSVLPENTPLREFYKSLGFKDEAFLIEMHIDLSE